MAKNVNYDAWENLTNPKYGETKQTTPTGYVGIRDAFKGAGLDDSQLGWKDGQVTYKGLAFTPDYVGDGISYGTKDNVNSFLNQAAQLDYVNVRDAIGSAGLDTNKLGWKDGQVTYNGATYKPDVVGDGITYGTNKGVNDFINRSAATEYVGIRDAFKGAGLDDSQLGWKDGQVTYKGIALKPDVIGSGTTYGSRKNVNDFIRRSVEADGGEVVQINQYMSPNGLYDVEWNDATKEVLIGGKSVPYLYFDENGNTFALKSDVDAAYNALGNSMGIYNPTKLAREYTKDYEGVLDDIDEESARKFSFDSSDLENDVVWKAYEDKYTREGKRAYEDSMAKVAARTGGNMSSMAQAAADQAYAYYMQQMTDKIPAIASDAYTRWLNDKNLNLDTMYKKADALGTMFNANYGASSDAYERFLTQKAEEDKRLYDKLEYDVKKSDAETTIAQNAYAVAEMYDAPVPSDIASMYGVTPKADGTYPTPNEIYTNKKWEIWNNVEKGIYSEQVAIELDADAKRAAMELSNAMALGAADVANYEKQLQIQQAYK